MIIQSLSCVPMCVKCRDVCECIAIWRSVPEADVDVEGLEFARNRVAKAAEGTSSLAPPQGVAANGTEGAPSESLVAPPQHAHVDFMPWQRWVVRRWQRWVVRRILSMI